MYALLDVHNQIGITEYRLMKLLPENLKSTLPSIEEGLRQDEKTDNESDTITE